jgi:hypothetical protein
MTAWRASKHGENGGVAAAATASGGGGAQAAAARAARNGVMSAKISQAWHQQWRDIGMHQRRAAHGGGESWRRKAKWRNKRAWQSA